MKKMMLAVVLAALLLGACGQPGVTAVGGGYPLNYGPMSAHYTLCGVTSEGAPGRVLVRYVA